MIRHLVFCNDNIDLGCGEGWFDVDITDFEYREGISWFRPAPVSAGNQSLCNLV